VAMAHPHRVFAADLPEAVEQRTGFENFDIRAAELRSEPALDHAAELRHQRLLAVADAEDRHARFESGLRRAWAVGSRHARRPPGENDGLGVETRGKNRIGP